MPFKRDWWEWGLQLISNIFRAIDYFDAVAVNGTHCGKKSVLIDYYDVTGVFYND